MWARTLGTNNDESPVGVWVEQRQTLFVAFQARAATLSLGYVGGSSDCILVAYNDYGVTLAKATMSSTGSDEPVAMLYAAQRNALYLVMTTSVVTAFVAGASASQRDIVLVHVSPTTLGLLAAVAYDSLGDNVATDAIIAESWNSILTLGISNGTTTFLIRQAFFYVSAVVPKDWEVTWNGALCSSVTFDSSSSWAFVAGYATGSIEGQSALGGKDAFLAAVDSMGVKRFAQLWGGSGDDAFRGAGLSGRQLMLFGSTDSPSIVGVTTVSQLALVTFCPAGQQQQTQNPNCSLVCADVPAGWYRPFGALSPIVCPAGYYCPQGSASPRLCDPGQNCPVQSLAPQPCPAGFFCPNGTLQFPCSTASLCPPGSALEQCPSVYPSTVGASRVERSLGGSGASLMHVVSWQSRVYSLGVVSNGSTVPTFMFGKMCGSSASMVQRSRENFRWRRLGFADYCKAYFWGSDLDHTDGVTVR